VAAATAAALQDRMMSFGNVELNNVKEGEDGNAAEMVVARGFASVVRHRSDEERSSVYETLLDLEEKAKQVGRGAGCLWVTGPGGHWLLPEAAPTQHLLQHCALGV